MQNFTRAIMSSTIKKTRKPAPTASPRASVTFPPELYQTLEGLARQKKVSVAWIVRAAAENYVAEQWPLFVKKPA